MNRQDRQAIEELFRHLYKSAEQAGPRDPEAEALIQQRFQQGPPGLLYHMAQTIVGQQHALREARAQLAGYQQQGGAPAGFAPPGPQGAGQQGYPPYGQPQPYQQQSGRPSFLAGAGKIALGVGALAHMPDRQRSDRAPAAVRRPGPPAAFDNVKGSATSRSQNPSR